MLRSRWIRALAVVALVGATLSATSSGSSATPDTPSLRLISVLHTVDATRFTGDPNLYLSPGVYLAATGGAFEIDALRGADGSITLWQVERDAQGSHRIQQLTPPAAPHFGTGLPAFFRLTMRNGAGKAVLTKNLAYCLNGGTGPGGAGSARVDPTGPDRPSYPYDCGGTLTKGMVWGIDQGWANSVDFGLRFAGPDGTYTLTIAITPSYARQLGIPATASTATVQVVVSTGSGTGCGDIKCPPPILPARRSPLGTRVDAAAPATEGGNAVLPTAALDQAATAVQGDGVPDLRALWPHQIQVRHDRPSDRDYLDFAATVWNAGSGPLVLEGFRNGAAEVMDATQFIYQDGKPVSSQVVGQFEYDNRRGHHHWHMEDIAQYDLLDKDGNRVLLSGKQSFCLAPTDAVDLTMPGADWQPDQAGLWSACEGESAIWLREVLPAGWGDTYYQNVAGQSFDITKVPNGHYQLRITADPLHHLEETSYDNNVGVRPITLGGTPGHRTITLG